MEYLQEDNTQKQRNKPKWCEGELEMITKQSQLSLAFYALAGKILVVLFLWFPVRGRSLVNTDVRNIE